jgi:hypothetical protein
MQAALKVNARVRAPHLTLKRTRNRRRIFFLHNAQHVKSHGSLSLIRECATFAATLLAIALWGAVLFLIGA